MLPPNPTIGRLHWNHSQVINGILWRHKNTRRPGTPSPPVRPKADVIRALPALGTRQHLAAPAPRPANPAGFHQRLGRVGARRHPRQDQPQRQRRATSRGRRGHRPLARRHLQSAPGRRPARPPPSCARHGGPRRRRRQPANDSERHRSGAAHRPPPAPASAPILLAHAYRQQLRDLCMRVVRLKRKNHRHVRLRRVAYGGRPWPSTPSPYPWRNTVERALSALKTSAPSSRLTRNEDTAIAPASFAMITVWL